MNTSKRMMRIHPYPPNANPVASFRDDKPLKAHPDYAAAKSGDIHAAIRLVTDLVKPESLAAAKARFDKKHTGHATDVIYLPVMEQEMSGKNQIPNALAAHYAANAGGVKGSGILQINKVYHTGADAMERLIARAEFIGDVVPGQRYVLVDDVSTMGCMLADLSSYIQSKGGEVAGSILLTNASRAGTINPDEKIISSLGERHEPTTIGNIFGIRPDALTCDESRYLIGFRTTDELRNRAAAAIAERRRRIASKSLPGTQAKVVPHPRQTVQTVQTAGDHLPESEESGKPQKNPPLFQSKKNPPHQPDHALADANYYARRQHERAPMDNIHPSPSLKMR